jgi:hypothetical protein
MGTTAYGTSTQIPMIWGERIIFGTRTTQTEGVVEFLAIDSSFCRTTFERDRFLHRRALPTNGSQ